MIFVHCLWLVQYISDMLLLPQDDEIENCQELIMMCEIHKERISNRILDLEPPGSPVPPQMDSIGDLPLQDTEANRDDEEMTDLVCAGHQ